MSGHTLRIVDIFQFTFRKQHYNDSVCSVHSGIGNRPNTCLLNRLTCKTVRIVHSSNRTASEVHFVLCESSSLVREDVLDLSEILRDVERPTLEGAVQGGVVHLLVPVDEVDLNNLDNLDGDVERDGYYHLRIPREGIA